VTLVVDEADSAAMRIVPHSTLTKNFPILGRSPLNKKMALVLDRTITLAEALRATVLAGLEIGSQNGLRDLKLLPYRDGDGGLHSCI